MPKALYNKPGNDKLSDAMEDLVPPEYHGTDKFIDIVTWNLRYFHDQDEERVEKISHIMNALNADIFVLEEILNGSLEIVVEKLKELGSGHYKTIYGTTGGDQRVAMMYDLDWIRAKVDAKEMFEKEHFTTSGGKEVFPRLPLHSYFTGLTKSGSPPFDFQLVGVHLKSQLGADRSTPQRIMAAEKLVEWLITDAQKIDADVIITGDWNEPPEEPTWDSFARLEEEGVALFRSLNNKNEISHLMYKNKNDFGSRLDLTMVTMASKHELAVGEATPVRWQNLEDLIKTNPKSEQIKEYIQDVSNSISDHMPVVTRFYFELKD